MTWTAVRALAWLLAVSLVAVVTLPSAPVGYAAVGDTGTSSGSGSDVFATMGEGLYRDTIGRVSWGTHRAPLAGGVTQRVVSWAEVAATQRVEVTCTMAPGSGQKIRVPGGTYASDGFAAAATATVAYPLSGLVVGDDESTSSGESVELAPTPAGSTWRVLDGFNPTSSTAPAYRVNRGSVSNRLQVTSRVHAGRVTSPALRWGWPRVRRRSPSRCHPVPGAKPWHSASPSAWTTRTPRRRTVPGELAIALAPVDEDGVTYVTIAYELPASMTTGNRAVVPLRQAAFDVRVEIRAAEPVGGSGGSDGSDGSGFESRRAHPSRCGVPATARPHRRRRGRPDPRRDRRRPGVGRCAAPRGVRGAHVTSVTL